MEATPPCGHEVIRTGEEYIASLRSRHLKVHLFGERVEEPVDHPIIRPSINAMAATYDASPEEEDLATGESGLTGEPVNRFLHVTQSAADLVAQGKMQRRLGQRTGTCFQRCVGMDAINSLFSSPTTSTPPGYRLPRPLPGLVDQGAAPQPRGRRSNDRRQRGPQQRARPSRPTPTCSCMWWSAGPMGS